MAQAQGENRATLRQRLRRQLRRQLRDKGKSDAVFGSITLAVKFEVAEIKQIAPDWAIARTNSAGTVKVNATGQGGPEANQELFAFQKISDAWKIARYCFSTTNPPRA